VLISRRSPERVKCVNDATTHASISLVSTPTRCRGFTPGRASANNKRTVRRFPGWGNRFGAYATASLRTLSRQMPQRIAGCWPIQTGDPPDALSVVDRSATMPSTATCVAAEIATAAYPWPHEPRRNELPRTMRFTFGTTSTQQRTRVQCPRNT
jgi:hypothetical protein